MSGGTSSGAYAPMPQAPTAQAPTGMSADGAAQSAWAPNVFTWVLTWRLLICVEVVVAIVAGLASSDAWLPFAAAAVWTIVSILPALAPPTQPFMRRVVLVVDLTACIALLAIAGDDATLSLLAAYACSSAVSWAAHRPIDAFIAGGACSAAFLAIVAIGEGGVDRPAGITGTLSLFLFFSLATSGFFTVAHRIGALEIATEISRERGRYRRDLHDRLGQALSGMHFEVQAVQAVGRDEHAASRLLSLADGYRDSLRMLKDLFRVGDEPMVGTNVASVIRQEARRMGQQASVQVAVDTTGDASRVPPWMRPHVVAVAGECVNNAVKNGHAGSIEIALDVTDDLLVLSITDDGVGFDNPPGTITEKEGHYGLREMAERARICGGEVVIASQPGFGTRVRLQVPIPIDATEDVLERDASKLRANVWTLLMALRVALGVVAIVELGSNVLTGDGGLGTLLIAAAVLLDVVAVAVLSTPIRRVLQAGAAPAIWYSVGTGIAYGAVLFWNIAPIMLLYAPLVLLGVGVVSGRRGAARASWAMLGVVVASTALMELVGRLSDDELRASLVHVTDIALLGMAAVQGAKLLDRLETLQIRVRYQALARLRHGLSGRMRDQLTERLEELERHARELATDTPDDDEAFAQAAARLTSESTELKQRLRDIVHTLADPTPQQGRTPAHV
ncbi:MAG: integral rane sensor signal transduction histidine kinase [Thermoleophilia bacterium]|nr:integral rane sensor signal transduction histidine kinase [Thermoleophilia bacterium]